MSDLSPKQVHAALQVISSKIENVAARASHGHTITEQHFRRMVMAIREGEKAHQRFRPSGCPREITFDQAINWFVVRCTVNALTHPDRTVKDLASLREDYVYASLMVESNRKAFSAALSTEECAIVEEYDYPSVRKAK